MRSDGSEVFGPERTWERLYDESHRYLTRKFWTASDPHTVEDAASEGFMRTLGKDWSRLPARNQDDYDRNWNYARRVLRLEAGAWLRGQQSSPEIPVSSLIPSGLSPDQEQDFVVNLFGAADVDVHDSVADMDMLDRAERVIAVLAQNPQEWNSWARDLLTTDLTEREVGKQEGVSHQAIHYRRVNGINRIQPLLVEHGLV